MFYRCRIIQLDNFELKEINPSVDISFTADDDAILPKNKVDNEITVEAVKRPNN